MPKYRITTSKLISEEWTIEALDKSEAIDKLFVDGKITNTKIFDFEIDDVIEEGE